MFSIKNRKKTRISYAYDIRLFFQFLIEENPVYKHHSIKDFQVQDLEAIQPVDIEEYLEYLKVYKNGDKTETNGERGMKRKLSALRRTRLIPQNVCITQLL